MSGAPQLRGFGRTDVSFGARNHLLVVPSVVCANGVAEAMEEEGAVAITHQHGCAQVGDDLSFSEATLRDVALNPNVGGVLVVGLGCETLRGSRLVEAIAARGRPVEQVGIQAIGGTEPAIAAARLAAARLRAGVAAVKRRPGASMLLGVAGGGPVADAVAAAVSIGASVVRTDLRVGPLAHTELAARGAQVIVSVCGAGELPSGSAIVPVINIGTDAGLLSALGDDFDLDGTGGPAAVAAAARELAADVFNGKPTAAERNGDAGFALRRLGVTL